MSTRTPTLLMILDGYGHREDPTDNAIYHANTPVMDRLWRDMPHTLIHTSGMQVGLPEGQMGNSEVGHMNLGAGRIVYQDFTRITKAIEDGDFNQNPALVAAVDAAVAQDKAVHIMGLVSPGGVHSHQDHIHAMIQLAAQRGASRVYLHAFLDGRDTPPRSAQASLVALDNTLKDLGVGHIASLIGRYYAMDRDARWERVQAAYQLLTQAQAQYHAVDAVTGLEMAYARGENDEFVQATCIHAPEAAPVHLQDGDSLIFMNFRADRAREISRAFVDQDFTHFARPQHPQLAHFVMLTEYAATLDAPCAFPPAALVNTLGEYLASLNKTQLRIAETEKYAHVTFFFSGGREQEYPGETRTLIPSPPVATYDLQPEMSAPELTRQLVAAIHSGQYDLIVCNYANGDMVGHTGVYQAAVQAVEALDACIGQVVEAIKDVGGQCLITADHGNAEQMLDPNTGQAHTAHTTCPVPLIYIPNASCHLELKPGRLCDIAPTLLTLMDLPIPNEMTGESLLVENTASAL